LAACDVKRSDAGDQVTSVMNALANCTDTEIYWPAMTGPCASGGAAAGRLSFFAAVLMLFAMSSLAGTP
jgi:hypothetical protein